MILILRIHYLKILVTKYLCIFSRIRTLNGKEHLDHRKTIGTIYILIYYNYVEVKCLNCKNSISVFLLIKSSSEREQFFR